MRDGDRQVVQRHFVAESLVQPRDAERECNGVERRRWEIHVVSVPGPKAPRQGSADSWRPGRRSPDEAGGSTEDIDWKPRLRELFGDS